MVVVVDPLSVTVVPTAPEEGLMVPDMLNVEPLPLDAGSTSTMLKL